MKKLFIALLVSVLVIGAAFAASNIDSAYQRASEEAGGTTTVIIEGIYLTEFKELFSLSLSEDDEKLVRLAPMAYSNDGVLVRPAGINILALIVSLAITATVCVVLLIILLFCIAMSNSKWKDQEDEEQMEYIRNYQKGKKGNG